VQDFPLECIKPLDIRERPITSTISTTLPSYKLFPKAIKGWEEILKHTTPIKHNIRRIFKDTSTTLKLQRPSPFGLIPDRADELRAKLDLLA
jgi:hypothetical protein